MTGDGGWTSRRDSALSMELARGEDGELARDRRSSPKWLCVSDPLLGFHLDDILEMWVPRRDIPFEATLSERRFLGECSASTLTFVWKYPSESSVDECVSSALISDWY